jgi:hypothetical protein
LRPDLETYYIIDQYLGDNLRGEELIHFESKLKANASFAQEVAEQRMLNDFILEAELKSVRSQLSHDLANIETPSFIKKNWQWMGLGILAAAGILYYSTNQKVASEKITSEKSDIEISKNEAHITSEIKKEVPAIKIKNNDDESALKNTTIPSKASHLKTQIVALDTIQTSIDPNISAPAKIATTSNTIIVPTVEIKKNEAVTKIDCSVSNIQFSLTSKATCQNDQKGAIYIQKVSGGSEPYTYTLNNKKIKTSLIENLSEGKYAIKISDKNGCYTEHTTTILEENCTPKIQQGEKFNINPTIGESCSIQFNTDKKGTITIYNRGGKIIYRVTNPSSAFIDWNGADGYGALAEPGLYIYMIDYTDGTTVSGEVNITR